LRIQGVKENFYILEPLQRKKNKLKSSPEGEGFSPNPREGQ
jgi:hypothetical protein